jgi:hypothetical protein
MVNLGQAAAILYGTSAPGNTNVLWAKTSTNDPNTWTIQGYHQYLLGSWSLISTAHYGNSAPAESSKVWLDTNFDPPIIKTYNGTSWLEINKLRSLSKVSDFTLSGNENNAFVNVNSSNNININIEDPAIDEFACTISRLGEGEVILIPAVGVLLNGINSALNIVGQWRSVIIRRLAANEFLVEGNI